MKNRLLALVLCLLGTTPLLLAQINLINEGGSTECSGELYDTGGPDGNYGDDEDFTYVICPTGQPECIEFAVSYYNFDNESLGDGLTIFDGDRTAGNATEIVSLGGQNGVPGDDGLVTGGVCFRTFASSGCLTIVFQSDDTTSLEGFAATWNCAPEMCDTAEPITVDTAVTAATIGEAIRGPGTVITNIQLTCPEGAAGVFSGRNSDLGLEQGVLLTTGQANAAIGPNTSANAGDTSGGNPFDGPGDPDLDALGALLGITTATNDACVLELDVIVDTDELVFDYTFGSEEYPEFVENDVNDIFAFFISGPGIEGEMELNGQENIAVLPNGRETVVQIDSVNSNANNEYYRNNVLGQSTEYDGLTSGFRGNPKTLRARATVQPCESYHLKLAIADRGDAIFDSGVFIAGLCGGLPQIDLTMNSGIDYLIEECLTVEDSIVITFNNVKDIPQVYALQTSGTATRNVDYLLPGLPTEIVFQPGFNRLVFPVVIIGDGVEEGEENIVFSFITDFGCNTEVDVANVVVPIREEVVVDLASSDADEPVFFCPGSVVELTATGASTYAWETDLGPIVAAGETTSVQPGEAGTVTLIGFVGTCTDTLEIQLEEANPTVELLNPDVINVCRGDTVQLEQVNNVLNQGVRYLNTQGFLDSDTTLSPRLIPQFSRFYVVQAGPDGGCAAQDSVFIDVEAYVRPELIGDTLICQGYDLPLLVNPINDPGNTVYSFSPGSFLADSTDPNVIYTPTDLVDTTFTLISNVENGSCADTQTVRVELIRSSLDIPQDTVLRCQGDEPALLTATADPADLVDSLLWFPSEGSVEPFDGLTYRVAPAEETVYFVSAIVNTCRQTDSVLVRVDSLPNTAFMLDPVKDPFCQGDTFTIRSPLYDVGDYPLITHEWTIAPGIASPQDLYNAIFFAQDSALVTRITTSGACERTDTIQVNVVKPPILIFDPLPALVCPGEPLQINVSFDPSGPTGTLEWEDPGNTLSCTDCLNPVATVDQTTVYMITVTADGSECTMPEQYRVDVITDAAPQLTDQTNICAGESVRLITGGIDPTATYRITGGGVDSDDPTVEVTPPADGTTYTVTVNGQCGEISQTVTINFLNTYTLTANGPDAICAGETATLTAQLSDGTEGTFVWTRPDGTTTTGLQIEADAGAPGLYSVTFTDAAGCGSATAEFTLNVVGDTFEPIIVATSAGGEPIAAGQSIFNSSVVTLSVLNVPEGLNVSYSWSGNLSPATGTDPTLTVTVPPVGEAAPDNLRYFVEITTDEGDCVFDAEIVISIVVAEFRIPELITPNGDGTNEIFRVFYTIGAEITDYSMTVFNRWGQQVFVSSDPDEAWDGTRNGAAQNTDTYLYLTTFRLNGSEVTQEGQFSLIR